MAASQVFIEGVCDRYSLCLSFLNYIFLFCFRRKIEADGFLRGIIVASKYKVDKADVVTEVIKSKVFFADPEVTRQIILREILNLSATS